MPRCHCSEGCRTASGKAGAVQTASERGSVRLLTLDHLDGGTHAARRARELRDGLEADLGGGDRLTVGERQLAQRAAVLGAIIEHN
jgi:hypothetical protein